jgi:hypothetical protein
LRVLTINRFGLVLHLTVALVGLSFANGAGLRWRRRVGNLKYYFAVLSVVGIAGFANAQSHDLVTNLQYRLKQGDMGEVVPGPYKNTRTLLIQKGGDELLKNCLNDPEHWTIDPLIFRFGHTSPLSTVGCRERTSPSLHIVFYQRPDGSRQARLHFDLYGPHNPLGHFSELLKNRLTFGRTSQYDVYRNLVKNESEDNTPVPERRYDYASHAREYLNATFGPKAIASAMFSAGASATFSRSDVWGDGFDRYSNRFEANIVRQTMRRSIEFGTAALLQQEQAFTSSQEETTGRRIRSALYHSFFVQGRNGNEFAFPRVAAAVGTGFIVHNWHPWQQQDINPWMQTTSILSRYVLQSFWQEFKPDIKSTLKNLLKRTHSPANPADPAQTTDSVPITNSVQNPASSTR